jgi:uncharacterized protein (TIGR02118 family)
VIKLIICCVRRADLTHEAFTRYWREQHGPLVLSVPEFTRHVRRYVQCHPREAGIPLGAAAAYDGVAELWFDDAASLARAFAEPRYLEIIRPDERKFADLERCVTLVTEEVAMI